MLYLRRPGGRGNDRKTAEQLADKVVEFWVIPLWINMRFHRRGYSGPGRKGIGSQ
jgi:hypothetical protein